VADCPTPNKQVFEKPLEFRPNQRGVLVGTYRCVCGYHHLTASKKPRTSHQRRERLADLRAEQLVDRLFILE
jgi:hypothetical protein